MRTLKLGLIGACGFVLTWSTAWAWQININGTAEAGRDRRRDRLQSTTREYMVEFPSDPLLASSSNPTEFLDAGPSTPSKDVREVEGRKPAEGDWRYGGLIGGTGAMLSLDTLLQEWGHHFRPDVRTWPGILATDQRGRPHYRRCPTR